jgi:ribosomal protein S18 acetylase RimI-like enzyme
MTQAELVEESNRQFIGAWRLSAEPIDGSEILTGEGLTLINPGVPLFLLNTAFLSGPLRDAADGRARAGGALAYFEGRDYGWLLIVCPEWASGEAGDALAATLSEAGLVPAFQLAGMSAEALAQPRHPLPADLEIRPVASEEQLHAILDLNCVANSMPIEMGRTSITRPDYWSAPRYGYVGYVNGEAVAAGALFVVDGISYIAWMATAEANRGKGYAEVIMRHALDQERQRSGITRTVLHATAAGEPVYRRLGYETHTRFTCWLKMPAPSGATA